MSDSRSGSSLSQRSRGTDITLPALVLGVVLSVVMGAANVYLGLRAGMTVSASIPAAVISMGILRGVLRRSSLQESNLVQTSASAGESLAAGIIFTMPALLLTGAWEHFHFWTTSFIALSGGLLGILLMIPMRKVFVVDNPDLKFPEGVACAEVLRVGDVENEAGLGRTGLRLIVAGILIGGLFKLLQSFLGIFRGTAEGAWALGGRVLYLGADISPALFAVGVIVTLPIALQILAGGTIGWLIAIPLIGSEGFSAEAPVDLAYEIWSKRVRYMGVGAMVVGGVSSIWSVRYGLLAAVRQLLDVVSRQPLEGRDVPRAEQNLSGRTIVLLGIACVLLIGAIYYVLLGHAVGLTLLTTAIMLVMSFFFAAVASYIVGLVGNSNSPVSGMTITAVLGTGAVILLFGFGGMAGIVATLGVAGIVCCVACTSGDVCNDLKTGHLVGASPRDQQIMQLIGVLVAAFVMAPVMTVLHEGSLNSGTGGIGGKDLPAPQAGLFASLAEGFFAEGELPKDMVLYGIGVGIAILVADVMLKRSNTGFRLHVMPVAVGIYLPFGLAAPIVLGGIVRALIDRKNRSAASEGGQPGVLMASGLIAGESLIGVLLGLFAYLGLSSLDVFDATAERFGVPSESRDVLAQALSLFALVAVAAWVYFRARSLDTSRKDSTR
jgi:putative OPT family oligopeptide transporter